MKILALDPAHHCGFALASTKDRIEASGVWNLGADPSNRPHWLAVELRKAISKHRPTVIAYEVATFGGRNLHAMRRLNELAGVIAAVAGEFQVECWAFGISTWKARAVGKGNADKQGVMRGLGTFYGIEVTNDNEADAIAIALAAQQGPPPEPAKKVISRTRKLEKKLPRLFR